MTWIEGGILSIGLFIGGILVVVLRSWLRNFISILVPSPQRTILAVKNLLSHRRPIGDRVRFVLGWFENDYKGYNTTAVSTTFAEIEGIELCRSARIVSASGAADEWRAAMRRRGKDLLRKWYADIAVVGRVDKDGEAVSLWFVSPGEIDTFGNTTSNPYSLRLSRLPDEFVDDLIVQIHALVLAVTTPKASDSNRRRLGLQQLRTAVPKLENLFRTLSAPEDRITLSSTYVLAQSSLGEWLGETRRLQAAIEKAREITKDADTRDHDDGLLTIRVNLARTLYILGEREGNPEHLAESASLLEDALDSIDQAEQASVAAVIKGIAASALRTLGNLEGSPEHLHRAASLLESALDVHQRQAQVDFVAISQNNLGLVCLDIARAAKQRNPIDRAISLFVSASRIAGRENMPTLWAMTQNNIGQALEALAEFGSGSDLTELERSRDRYQKAVRGYSRTQTPYHMVSAMTNLARVLTRLGAIGESIDYIDQAIKYLQDAYSLSSKNEKWTSVGTLCAGLGAAHLERAKLRGNARDAEKAVPWLEKALETYNLTASPDNWVKVKTNLALSYFQLSEAKNDFEPATLGFSCLEEIFIEHDLDTVLVACPEPYIALYKGIELIKSMPIRSGYLRDWIAKWVPAFTQREHKGPTSHILGITQCNIATVSRDFAGLTDAIELYRRALANLTTHDDSDETVPGSGVISRPQPLASIPIDTDGLVANVKRDLGTACWMLGEERSCAKLLREAIALFDEVLAGLDPAIDHMDCAVTQSSRGRAYKVLYHVDGDVEFLRLSLSAYDEASEHLVDGVDSPWHRQVPGRREEVRRLLEQAGDAS